MGVSLNGGFPPFHTPKRAFLVGKPIVVGYHHFRKPLNLHLGLKTILVFGFHRGH